MMVIMKPGHTGQQFEDVMKRIEEATRSSASNAP
jgi:hypothetical protein